jgi:hypothetical protein
MNSKKTIAILILIGIVLSATVAISAARPTKSAPKNIVDVKSDLNQAANNIKDITKDPVGTERTGDIAGLVMQTKDIASDVTKVPGYSNDVKNDARDLAQDAKNLQANPNDAKTTGIERDIARDIRDLQQDV